MKNGIALAIITHLFAGLPSAWADDDLPLPTTAAPVLMKVSIDKEELLCLRTVQQAWKILSGPSGLYYQPDGTKEQFNFLKEKDIAKIYDTSGKPLAFKDLRTILKKGSSRPLVGETSL